MEVKSILFPTDFSERANIAIGEVASFAKVIGAKLTVCHFYYRPIPKNSDFVDYDNRMLRARESKIDQEFEFLKEIFPDLQSSNVHFVRMLDTFSEGIIALLKKHPADMIAMATKGAKGIDEFFGSKTYKISESVDLPVLALPDNTTLKSIKRIGVATNFDPDTALNGVGIIKHLSKTFNSKIDIIHVTGNNSPILNEDEAKMSMKLHEHFKAIDHEFNYVQSEDVALGLVEFCDKNDINLVAVLPTQRNFIEGIFHNSVTKRLAHHVNLPLLILK